MKLSIDTCGLKERFSEEEIFKMLKNAGFESVDYSMCYLDKGYDMLTDDYREKALKTKELADKYGLTFGQAHAPFSIGHENEFCEEDKEYLKIVRSLEYASIIDAKNVVIHSIKNFLPEGTDVKELNIRFFKSLEPYAKKFGVKISIENLFFRRQTPDEPLKAVYGSPENTLEFIKALDSDVFNMCFDMGHSAITGHEVQGVIERIGSEIAIMHVQDTDLKDDCHMPPFTMKQNWEEIAKALAKSGYKGDFSLEIPSFTKRMPPELLESGLKFAHDCGRLMIEKIEYYKNNN